MDAGFRSFKCATLREAELLLENGVEELIFAYPLVHPKKIDRFLDLKKQYSDASIKAIVSTPEHLDALSNALSKSTPVTVSSRGKLISESLSSLLYLLAIVLLLSIQVSRYSNFLSRIAA